ncbi:Holliday junction resolvase [Mycobacteroides sp. H001]|uniref:Holliday junction resolvase RuvX n=1 Tax=Mycobacteroides TaxID=670516 RepID=UPI000713F1F6|nr:MULTISPECIES: Holliday junction resolvase RuvX [Mycobacteroides]KRQ22782.1 Holliday junction resolvase [Mycobacteroides sp. H072]KRQ40373.1 Holliday junction resolvase [Mycobacteroides sp. H002]KRQ47632.1 Holliday junction resolvase [Mycobacteroides sp. H054]KRQ70895.1 Holliday junction resolvase [Mycobacteroides sp. H001]OHU40552.1 Holliday junction DNA helicase RuvA [Mycobacteroides chelonae]
MPDSEAPAPDRPGPDDPGRGRRLGVDVGTVRIGVASCDPDGILATPVETVARDNKEDSDFRRIVELVEELSVVEVVVGLPRNLREGTGASALDAAGFARELSERIAPVPVRLVDERFTTTTAQRSLREAGVRSRQQRGIIDQAAAVAILQDWLEQRRRCGSEGGTR